MKARVIETGVIEEFQVNELNDYFTKDGVHYKGLELDFEDVEPDYWAKLKHQYAGMIAQGVLSNEKMQQDLHRIFGKDESMDVTIAEFAIDVANTLIEKLKNK